MTNFDRFTERARTALSNAHQEAQRLSHASIGPEHLLLGLIEERNGFGARILTAVGVSLPKLRDDVISAAAAKPPPSGETGLSSETKRVLELAIEEGRFLGHHYIGTEHLLVGLFRQEDSTAATTLRNAGVTLEGIRAEIERAQGDVLQSEEHYQEQAVASGRPATSAIPFDRFTERAKTALRLAQEEALRLNHNYIGTEHLLLGLVREGHGVAASALESMNVNLVKVRSAVEFIVGRGEGTVTGDIGLTPRAKHVLELAIDESRRLEHQSIGTHHLLLGLIREGEGIGAGVLEALEINLDSVRRQVIDLLNNPPAGTEGDA
jgi:ATP-dependent Clp protease ATP-binding subunit ClpA